MTKLHRTSVLVSSAAVGAANAWRSVGPCPVPVSQPARVDAYWGLLSRTPVVANDTHHKVLEAVFTGPVAHWLAIPVSNPDPPYQLSYQRLEEASALLAEFVSR